MCKHILIQKFTANDLDYVREFTARTHENDGYGAIIRLKNGKIDTLKSLNAGEFYIELTRRMLLENIETLVVHHRTSTNGYGIEYAHPFEFLGNYLTHNGVVSVPEKHDTLTSNDSEALLHHLIKNSFETENISGYFSVFLLNETETHVLVDSIAPLYGNGRVYCSHNLSPDFQKIERTHLIFDRHGALVSQEEIKVRESTYGVEYMGRSLGNEYESRYLGASLLSSDDIPDPYDVFLDSLTPQEQWEISDSRTSSQGLGLIKEKAAQLGLSLDSETEEALIEFFFG